MSSFLPSIGELWENFMDALFGSPSDSIRDVMEFLLLARMIPAYDVIEDPYNNMFILALVIATLTTLFGLAFAARSGSPLRAIEAIGHIVLVIIVAHALPWLSLFLYQLFHGLSDVFVDLIGVEETTDWWEPLLNFNPSNGMVHGFGALSAWGIVFTQTIALLLNLFLLLLGPTLFALRLVPRFGNRANRTLWVGMTWSASIILVSLIPLGVGLVLIRLLPSINIGGLPQIETIAVMFVLVAGLVAPYVALYWTRKAVVSIENAMNQNAVGRMVTGSSVAKQGESDEPSRSYRFAKGATFGAVAVRIADNSSPNTGFRQMATAAGLGLSKRHPYVAASAAGADILARKAKQNSASTDESATTSQTRSQSDGQDSPPPST